MENIYRSPDKIRITWPENYEGYDCLHNLELDKELPNSQIEEKVIQEETLCDKEKFNF